MQSSTNVVIMNKLIWFNSVSDENKIMRSDVLDSLFGSVSVLFGDDLIEIEIVAKGSPVVLPVFLGNYVIWVKVVSERCSKGLPEWVPEWLSEGLLTVMPNVRDRVVDLWVQVPAFVKQDPIKCYFLLLLRFIFETHAHQVVDKLEGWTSELVFSEELDAITLSVGEEILVKEKVFHILI